jgi:hypothetical protein
VGSGDRDGRPKFPEVLLAPLLREVVFCLFLRVRAL